MPSWGRHTLPSNVICRLHKSIYGLKQVSHQWFHKFSSALILEGFLQSSCDHSLFTKSHGSIFLAIIVYVDDILVASNNQHEVETLVSLNKQFKMKDLGTLKYFFGLRSCQINY